MRLLFAGLFAAAFLGGGSLLCGQEPALFERLDANKDGEVTEDEVTDERGKRLFERLIQTADKNEDKKLSKEEFQAGLRERRREAPAEGQPPRRRPDGQPAGPPVFPRADLRMAEELFNRWDANEDGKLTADEVPADRREQFERLLGRIEGDDKAITKEQFGRVAMGFLVGGGPPPFGPGMTPMPMALLRVLDGDGDGELSKEEIANAAKSLAKLDKNEDGKLSRNELMPAGAGPFPGRPGEGRPGEPRPQGRPDADRPEGARRGGFNAEEFVRRLKEADADGDGKLSKEESPERMKENFDRVDANGDGFIDEAEVKTLIQRFREGAEGRRPEGRREEGGRPQRDRPPSEGEEKEEKKDDGE